MLVVVSPAKNLDYESSVPVSEYTQPELLDDASQGLLGGSLERS